ncbi:pilus assembly protein PilW [Paracidovorax avenae]|uniref:PilW family protein n=1 Tax=Paracidovorax avenae TaxID=80867 RepID=UPI000D20E17D|nr:PilW family protein [Paracidovorax avenae]AVS78599.1 pilus assembly protein PilW [Paracidovorax avenae]
MNRKASLQAGLTLIELLIAMAISLLIVLAAAYLYLSATNAQRVQDRTTASNETGAFAMQMLGRSIMNAGFYPANVAPIPADITQTGMYDTYPPLPSSPRVATDWANPAANWPPVAFQTGVFGCDGAQFNTQNSTCGTSVAGAPDTLVINYFTSDSVAYGATGQRLDCTGADVGGDPSNAIRKTDAAGTAVVNTPPQLPLFVSNRYTLNNVNLYVGQGTAATGSLACSGNGGSPHGDAGAGYQPLLAGIEDMQFTYGLYSGTTSLSPDRFYTATEINALSNVVLNGQTFTGWQRVVSIRVCILTKTLNGNARIADKTGSEKTYQDCSGQSLAQPAGVAYSRFVEVFGVRNNLKQSY